jgi:hypothetical protein
MLNQFVPTVKWGRGGSSHRGMGRRHHFRKIPTMGWFFIYRDDSTTPGVDNVTGEGRPGWTKDRSRGRMKRGDNGFS